MVNPKTLENSTPFPKRFFWKERKKSALLFLKSDERVHSFWKYGAKMGARSFFYKLKMGHLVFQGKAAFIFEFISKVQFIEKASFPYYLTHTSVQYFLLNTNKKCSWLAQPQEPVRIRRICKKIYKLFNIFADNCNAIGNVFCFKKGSDLLWKKNGFSEGDFFWDHQIDRAIH